MNIEIEFTGKIWYWRGPAPFYFVTVPEPDCHNLKAISGLVTYGWGMIPVHARIGKTKWTTSMWPKDGGYIVPLKTTVRKAENLAEGYDVTIRIEVH